MERSDQLEDLLLDFLLHRKGLTATQVMPQSKEQIPPPVAVPLPAPQLTRKEAERDHDYICAALCPMGSKLHGCVLQVLNAHEYEGSPLYQGPITRDYLAQLVDHALRIGSLTYNDIEEIFLETPEAWSRHVLMRSAIEGLILMELFGVRRYRYQNRECGCQSPS